MESTATGSSALDLHIILTLIFQMEQRLCESVHASNQKQLIETSLIIIECTSILIHNLDHQNSDIMQVLDKLYFLLSFKAFLVTYGSILLFISVTFIHLLFWVMLLIIKEHNESILYGWAQHSAMQNVWPEEEFHQWDLLKHVLAIVVIEKLQMRFDVTGSLPKYDYWVYMEVAQLPWLLDIYSPSSCSDGVPNPLEYSKNMRQMLIAIITECEDYMCARLKTAETIMIKT
ncbi:hypothetical protein ARMGADRAFT_1115980 [Armillaria gallica]|uniref:Uncharacterized protein n=1 Tax=Armillaria gallica TaxID=47427 RepID=A0A2H3D3H0_ARMGA|nr:hypothetical protein ARMGADRAFT_1115980 [Armillaria gallica]